MRIGVDFSLVYLRTLLELLCTPGWPGSDIALRKSLLNSWHDWQARLTCSPLICFFFLKLLKIFLSHFWSYTKTRHSAKILHIFYKKSVLYFRKNIYNTDNRVRLCRYYYYKLSYEILSMFSVVTVSHTTVLISWTNNTQILTLIYVITGVGQRFRMNWKYKTKQSY